MKNSNGFIDMNSIEKMAENNVTPQMRAFVASQIGRENMKKMSKKAWMDFFLGASLWGLSVGTQRIGG